MSYGKDPEHLVECHHLAESRRKRGLPSWGETVDVTPHFRDESLPFPEKRDAIVRALKSSWWVQSADCPLQEIVEGVEQSEDEDEFDGWWSDLYDRADCDRVWIKTF